MSLSDLESRILTHIPDATIQRIDSQWDGFTGINSVTVSLLHGGVERQFVAAVNLNKGAILAQEIRKPIAEARLDLLALLLLAVTEINQEKLAAYHEPDEDYDLIAE